MRIFLAKHIHSCFASASSNDVTLYREVEGGEFEVSSCTISPNFGFTVLYEPSDKTFYDMGLKQLRILDSFEETPEFQALVQSYLDKGYSHKNEWLEGQQKKYWEAKDKAYYQQRLAEGYVIPSWHGELKLKDYQGGFSDTIFNEPELQKYLAEGGCHGYICHGVRKPELDTYIQETFLKLKQRSNRFSLPQILACWLTSTNGRYFGDSLMGLAFEEQKKKINTSLTEIYNYGFVYKLPEHEGTYDSTLALSEKYKNELFI